MLLSSDFVFDWTAMSELYCIFAIPKIGKILCARGRPRLAEHEVAAEEGRRHQLPVHKLRQHLDPAHQQIPIIHNQTRRVLSRRNVERDVQRLTCRNPASACAYERRCIPGGCLILLLTLDGRLWMQDLMLPQQPDRRPKRPPAPPGTIFRTGPSGRLVSNSSLTQFLETWKSKTCNIFPGRS